MRVSILSSRDTVSNVVFTLSYNVTFGPPSAVFCRDDESTIILHSTRDDPNLLREVLRSQHVNSLQPDMTRVTVKVNQPREEKMFVCAVTVEGRVHIEGINNYKHDTKGTGTSSVMVTGE